MSEEKQNKKSLFIIDGNSLMFRAYYALRTPMTTSEGFPTGAIYGFLNMLFKLLDRNPTHLAVAFDLSKPTFRHKLFDGYKAGRKPTPEDIKIQMPVLQTLLNEMGIAVLSAEGYEADDILGTLSKKAESLGFSILLITGDRDSMQLISEQTHVLLTKKGITDTVEVTESVLHDLYGLSPKQMIDLKSLMGDASDNIPGIPGIGEKNALALLEKYKTLDNILSNSDTITGKLGEKIQTGSESALLSRELGTICRNVPLTCELEDLLINQDSFVGGLETLRKLELKSIISKIPQNNQNDTINSFLKPEQIILDSYETAKRIIEENNDKIASISLEGGFSFAFDKNVSYICEPPKDLFSFCLEPIEIFKILNTYCKKFICYDGKKLMHFAKDSSDSTISISFDVKIADYLISSNRPSDSLVEICSKYAGFESEDAAVLFILQDILLKSIQQKGMEALYYDIELKLSSVLFEMEETGFLIDSDVLIQLNQEFQLRQNKDEKLIFGLAGEDFNILSPKQLGHVLFEKLQLPSGRKTKTGYSTDSDTLDLIMDEHPIVPLIADYRLVSKLRATFIEGLLHSADSIGKVHSTFNQCVTATGRISSNDPNLQNIPTRTDDGKKIRRAFVSSPGHVLVDADYSQIELRLLAHLCGDDSLIAAFNSGLDIHTKTASEVFDVPFEEVTKAQRSAAKAVNFGIIYGISDFGLARNLNISVKEAGEYIKQYLSRYPSIQNYMNYCIESARESGYAKTMWGRIRPIPELKSSNFNVRSFGERVAMNMPIQGSAADIIKIAMIRVRDALIEGGYKSKLTLQVHDELIVDTLEEELDSVSKLVRSCMENVAELKVKLLADVSVAQNWAEAK